jgi:hypothetical protein
MSSKTHKFVRPILLLKHNGKKCGKLWNYGVFNVNITIINFVKLTKSFHTRAQAYLHAQMALWWYILKSATNWNVVINSQILLSFILITFKRIEAYEIILWSLYVCVCVCVSISILETGGDSWEIWYALYATGEKSIFVKVPIS